MDEYIEKEAAFSSIPDDYYGWRDKQLLKSIPSADVIPAVHCRDCRFWEKNFPEDGYGWCQNYVAGLMDRNENFFCAVGVGKENT